MSLGAIAPGAILAHGVRLTPDQARLASDAGCWFAHCPRSNEGNRVGYADALSAASRVALGTDGWDADMADEQATLLRLATARGETSAGGRLAAGHALVAERFGAVVAPLAPGSLGDLVVRRAGEIRHVVVGGRIVVADGALATAKMDSIVDEARAEAGRLWSRMATI